MMVPTATFFTLLRNYNPIVEQTSPLFKQAFNSYGKQVLDLFKEHFKAKNSNTPVKSLGSFFAKLDGKLKSISDPGIVEGWRTYFNSQPQSVKSEMYKILPKPTFLGKNFPQAKVVSMSNILSGPISSPVNSPDSKIPTNLVDLGVQVPSYILSTVNQASEILGRLNNKNKTSILNGVEKNDTNHATNLAPDTKHVERMMKTTAKFTKEVLKGVGDASSFVLKAMSFNPFGVQNNDISSPPLAIDSKVEGLNTVLNSVGLDVVKKNVKPLKDYSAPKLLKG